MEEYMLPCMNKKLLGIECFGCGTQRSFLLLIKGDFIGAFNLFPAIFTTVLFFLVLTLHFLDKSRNYQKAIISLAVINAIIMVVSYFYRLTN